MNTPNQKYVFQLEDAQCKDRQIAIHNMVGAILGILSDCKPSIYMYGSLTMNDFRFGWSDIDILVLTDKQIAEEQAQKLVRLRQTMLDKEPDNQYYRSFEGGMLTLDAFLSNKADRVVYWGTSGERIAESYTLDSFGMTELLESGVLLYGGDIRGQFNAPVFDDLYADIKRHYEAIRKHAQTTGRDFYSYGWLLDISRCIYTLRTGKIISKTAAGEWALQEQLCPCDDALVKAVEIRKEPVKFRENELIFDYAERLGEYVQRYADVLEHELGLY